MNLFFAVLTPFLGAVLVALAARRGRALAAWSTSGVVLLALLLLLPALVASFGGTTTIQRLPWIPTT
ncbi:MAG: hypothetical protein Q8N33_03800, partial [Rhodocyclaceae bacterium]|nr:hypothetical protein [Rhodocyclaceae bacterium]